MRNLKRHFQKFAQQIAETAGSPYAFLGSLAIVLVWAAAGPVMKYSETWMLVINTLTTIVTFLMVFVIQSAQNRDSRIARIERQSLLRAISDAPDTLLALDQDPDERLDQLQEELAQARHEAESNE